MSKKRVLCTIAGSEMVDSSDTDDDDLSDREAFNQANKRNPDDDFDDESDEDDDMIRDKKESTVNNDPEAATNLKPVWSSSLTSLSCSCSSAHSQTLSTLHITSCLPFFTQQQFEAEKFCT